MSCLHRAHAPVRDTLAHTHQTQLEGYTEGPVQSTDGPGRPNATLLPGLWGTSSAVLRVVTCSGSSSGQAQREKHTRALQLGMAGHEHIHVCHGHKHTHACHCTVAVPPDMQSCSPTEMTLWHWARAAAAGKQSQLLPMLHVSLFTDSLTLCRLHQWASQAYNK